MADTRSTARLDAVLDEIDVLLAGLTAALRELKAASAPPPKLKVVKGGDDG